MPPSIAIALDAQRHHYIGFIKVPNKQFVVRLDQPSSKPASTSATKPSYFVLSCEPILRNLLHGHEKIVEQRLMQCENDANAFLLELQQITQRLWNVAKPHILPPSHFYERLMREVEKLGWQYVIALDDSLTTLRLKVLDAASREHFVSVKLPSDYPYSAPQCIVDLPCEFVLRWSAANSSLRDIIDQLSAILASYQDFWLILDDIDVNTWVIEPIKPSKAIAMRRIVIGKHCSVIITIDAEHPRRICESRFLGADSVVRPLKEKLSSSLIHWNVSLFPRENLQQCLSLEFPDASVADNEEFELECGICYSNNLDGIITDCVCDNDQCGRPFHNSCLYEWLRSNPSTMKSFDTVFGVCPYCSTALSATLSKHSS